MITNDTVRSDIKNSHFQQVNQYSIFRTYTLGSYDHDIEIQPSNYNLHSFIVDWQLYESENSEKFRPPNTK